MPTKEARRLRSNCLRRPWTTSGGVEALVRTLTSHTQHIPNRLPRQADIPRSHHGLIELALGGTEAYLRDRNFCESGIVDRGHRIRTVSVVGVL